MRQVAQRAIEKWVVEPAEKHNASMDVEGPYIKNSQRFRTKITLGRWLWQGAHLYFIRLRRQYFHQGWLGSSKEFEEFHSMPP